MSSAQISPSSLLMNPAEVNPLASPGYQQTVNKNLEQTNKAIEQIKTDTVTLSQEAIARSMEVNTSDDTTGKKSVTQVNGAIQSTQQQFITKTGSNSNNDNAPSPDQVSISREAYVKLSLFNAISDLAELSASEKLKLT